MDDAYLINSRMDHRGGCGFEENTGDGAGILLALPDSFFQDQAKKININLPDFGSYAVGNIFLPQDQKERSFCKKIVEQTIKSEGQKFLGWRKVPINPKKADVGPAARDCQPEIEQVFVQKSTKLDQEAFERKLYLIRKIFTKRLRYQENLSQASLFYACTLSSRLIAYKGMLTPAQLFPFFPDLENKKFETHLAMVHSRFSTNTFPSWDRAQPNRYMCHNGEINTLKGNVSRMIARQELIKSELISQEDLDKIFPIILSGKSDSASMDMVVELLLLTGRSLPEVMMMLVPEAWEKHKSMNDSKKAFYEFNSCIMEPWDGPASIPFTDGNYIGALLDRNGLRPSRYSVTKDGYVIMSSETGVVDIKPENIELHGRLEPGKMFLVDMNEGRIIQDDEVKKIITSKYPYRKWLNENILPLSKVPYTGNKTPKEKIDFETRLKIFGYTHEDFKTIILPMCNKGKEAIGSMGSDTPLAVLSKRPQLLYNYFKQLFAQVTNPPLDGILEEISFSKT